MKKNTMALEPISMSTFRQFIYDCGASLMGKDYDKEQIIGRLLTLADYPVRFGTTSAKESVVPKVKVIINDGVVSDVLADGLVDVEVVIIDKDFSDYEQLRHYEHQLYEDKSLEKINYTSANFEAKEGA